MTSIRLPELLEARLEYLARHTKRSKSFFIKEALEQYLEDMEDAYIALERIAQPNPKFSSSEDVLKRLRKKSKKSS